MVFLYSDTFLVFCFGKIMFEGGVEIKIYRKKTICTYVLDEHHKYSPYIEITSSAGNVP